MKKNRLLKQLHILVRSLNKNDNKPGDWIFGVCKKYLFKNIDKENVSIENKTLFTSQKENVKLIIYFVAMYIDFDD